MKKDDKAIVYGIKIDGDLKYVGYTTNFKRRKSAHLHNENKSNKALNDAIKADKSKVVFEQLGEGTKQEMLSLEKSLIKKNKDDLYNIASGGIELWQKSDSKPWSAGQANQPPSSIILRYLSKQKAVPGLKPIMIEAKGIRSGMSDKQRIAYEVSLHQYIVESLPQKADESLRWFEACKVRMLTELEAA